MCMYVQRLAARKKLLKRKLLNDYTHSVSIKTKSELRRNKFCIVFVIGMKLVFSMKICLTFFSTMDPRQL